MSTPAQTSYIADLAVLKTKEFKEVKELLVSQAIVAADSETVATAGTLAEICNALTDQQATQLINALIAAKAPERGRVYAQSRIKKTIAGLDGVKSTIAEWDFN
jgi:hypothetical protein